MLAVRVARVVLVLCALAAAAAAVTAGGDVATAATADRLVQAWRMIGFATFAALFALLAARPQVGSGWWLVLIGNKVVLSASALTWLASTPGSLDMLIWDGALTFLLVAAFVLTRSTRTRSNPALVAPARAA